MQQPGLQLVYRPGQRVEVRPGIEAPDCRTGVVVEAYPYGCRVRHDDGCLYGWSHAELIALKEGPMMPRWFRPIYRFWRWLTGRRP